MSARKPRVLAVASGGGHWVQMMRLWPALEEADTAFVTVSEAYRPQARGRRFYVVPDATRWNKLGLIRMSLRVLQVLLRERPDAVISTGAAPGYVALRLGKWLGARTLWLDSIANVEELSLSGRRIGKHVDVWLTQWPHLASDNGPTYRGAVL
ncbi:MAG: UDP-N-acetylglucosamine--LPS N-acetylglucosamine transferase [Planctomycetota bacterium]|nr:MAG: UDP-N-acetylglucosamine--LPS N-acetylglucosamine transferase [Planctomycetota bacterium]